MIKKKKTKHVLSEIVNLVPWQTLVLVSVSGFFLPNVFLISHVTESQLFCLKLT
jgi:hypothetical protein